jgi:hypothetical protein
MTEDSKLTGTISCPHKGHALQAIDLGGDGGHSDSAPEDSTRSRDVDTSIDPPGRDGALLPNRHVFAWSLFRPAIAHFSACLFHRRES